MSATPRADVFDPTVFGIYHAYNPPFAREALVPANGERGVRE